MPVNYRQKIWSFFFIKILLQKEAIRIIREAEKREKTDQLKKEKEKQIEDKKRKQVNKRDIKYNYENKWTKIQTKQWKKMFLQYSIS